MSKNSALKLKKHSIYCCPTPYFSPFTTKYLHSPTAYSLQSPTERLLSLPFYKKIIIIIKPTEKRHRIYWQACSSFLTQFSIPSIPLQLTREVTNHLHTAATPFLFVMRQDGLWKAFWESDLCSRPNYPINQLWASPSPHQLLRSHFWDTLTPRLG